MSGIAVLRFGPTAPGAAPPPPGLAASELSTEDLAAPAALEEIAARSLVLWLPAWASLQAAEWAAIREWVTRSRSAVARVRLALVGADFSVPLGAALVLSRPGAVRLRAGIPTALGARAETLPGRWSLVPPPTLAEHLQGLNHQSSEAVRLSPCGGHPPSSLDLLRPLGLLPKALLSGRGPLSRRLPRLALEGYRRVLLAAKAWERTHAPAAGPQR